LRDKGGKNKTRLRECDR